LASFYCWLLLLQKWVNSGFSSQSYSSTPEHRLSFVRELPFKWSQQPVLDSLLPLLREDLILVASKIEFLTSLTSIFHTVPFLFLFAILSFI